MKFITNEFEKLMFSETCFLLFLTFFTFLGKLT